MSDRPRVWTPAQLRAYAEAIIDATNEWRDRATLDEQRGHWTGSDCRYDAIIATAEEPS